MEQEGKKFNFEQSFDELNEIIEKMEKGNLPLEESLQAFEQGIQLIRNCQTLLTEAEQKVKILTEQQGEIVLADYKNTDITNSE